MKIRLDEVVVQWKSNGEIDPQRFVWLGQAYVVESVGRSWRDDEGYHVLCMTPDTKVYELILTMKGEWLIQPPLQSGFMA